MSSIRVDIVSDVVCPWCIVGWRQLQLAVEKTGIEIDVQWHPFELNPQMSDEGQNLQDHICEKYGITVEQSNANRENLTQLGNELGFTFKFDEKSRMVNTYKAHQLLHWAAKHGHGHALKMALFSAYFTNQQDVNDSTVLMSIVESLDLDTESAREVLEGGIYQQAVRSEQQIWTSRGITGVPAMVFNNQYLVNGAQGVDSYTEILEKIKADS
ncbi:MAG: DsbA family protein [Granulosicoccus sp.]